MIAYADDTLLCCLVAAALVVMAHGLDAVAYRDRDDDGWARSLAWALCGVALGVLAVAAFFAPTRTDRLIAACTAAATVVSLMPLVGLRPGGVRRQVRRINPWDSAFRIQPGRAERLLNDPSRPHRSAGPSRPDAVRSSTPSMSPAPSTPSTLSTPPTPSTSPASPPRSTAPDPASTPDPATREVQEAEVTLHDVSAVVGDLDRLLGLDRPPRRS